MMDNAGGFIEFDVKRPEAEPEDASTWTTLTKTGPIDSRCPQTQPLRMINCVGHLHIGELASLPAALLSVVCSTAVTGWGWEKVCSNKSACLPLCPSQQALLALRLQHSRSQACRMQQSC